jgi:hypothetical protein
MGDDYTLLRTHPSVDVSVLLDEAKARGIPLRVVDMSYGSGITQTFQDDGFKDSHRSTWVRFAFNAYQPWVQLNLGYRVIYKDFSTAIGQQMSFGMFAGI